MNKTTLIKSSYLTAYKGKLSVPVVKLYNVLRKQKTDPEMLSNAIDCASVYSSMIEGNNVDLSEFHDYRVSKIKSENKSFSEIEDLIKAYHFAESSELNEVTFMKVHSLLSKTLIPDSKYRGKIRDRAIFTIGPGENLYSGAPVETLKDETRKLFHDISILLERRMSLTEVFYYASFIHLVLLKIHPFADGNSRSARLLEKWFIALKTGKQAWYLPSEKLYHTRHKSYYRNRMIGVDYNNLNYKLCLPFLLMLPSALTTR